MKSVYIKHTIIVYEERFYNDGDDLFGCDIEDVVRKAVHDDAICTDHTQEIVTREEVDDGALEFFLEAVESLFNSERDEGKDVAICPGCGDNRFTNCDCRYNCTQQADCLCLACEERNDETIEPVNLLSDSEFAQGLRDVLGGSDE